MLAGLILTALCLFYFVKARSLGVNSWKWTLCAFLAWVVPQAIFEIVELYLRADGMASDVSGRNELFDMFTFAGVLVAVAALRYVYSEMEKEHKSNN